MPTVERHHVGAALLALLSCAGAQAASFDCKQAKTVTETALCASPALSALDERMAQTYQRALQALSPAGAAALRASQRSWLRYVPQVCAPALKTAATARAAHEACVANEWQNRIRILDQAGLKLGALVLTRVDRYATHAAPADDGTGRASGLVAHHVGRLQIDAAGTPATRAWSEAGQSAAASALPRDGDNDEGSDIDVNILIGCASARLLSIETTSYEYPHGAAHGVYATAVNTVWLDAGMRPLAAAELFTGSSGWQRQLPTLFWQAHLSTDRAARTEAVEQAIRVAAVDERRWLVTPAGLQISFSAYEGGSYADTPGPITVRWAALQPLMAAGARPSCDFSSVDAP